MLVSTQDVQKTIKQDCINLNLSFDKTNFDRVIGYMLKVRGVPRRISVDMLSLKSPLSEYSPFLVFCLIEAMDYVLQKDRVSRFFTETEIQYFSHQQMESKSSNGFPIVIKCIPVSGDQWIGSIDINFLIMLREKQITRYNENTQRVMERVVLNNTEMFKISVNNSAVTSIKKAFEDGIYIPDDITFNIPVDGQSDFYYDNRRLELVINYVNALDIADGYHRLLAIYRTKEEYPDFNYPMEIRITNFTEEKVKQFIFQKDQKTKMRKIDSDSMNMNSCANIVVERLNQDVLCNFRGLLGRNSAIIPFAEFAKMIDFLWFKPLKNKTEAQKLVLPVTQEIKEKLNLVAEEDPSTLTRRMSFIEVAILTVFLHDFSLEELAGKTPIIRRCVNRSNELSPIRLQASQIRKPLINDIRKLIGKEIGNV